jgi:Domain of unknown function (DUF4365)
MLDDKRRKSRYSLSYLYAICAQAGLSAQETRQDEDIEAIDAWVNLVGAPVPVQCKCTSSPEETRAGYRVDFEDGWITSWKEQQLPVFIVLGRTDGAQSMDSPHSRYRHAAPNRRILGTI